MLASYHPGYVVNIGAGHRFPMLKYGLAYERLLAEGTLATDQIVAPSRRREKTRCCGKSWMGSSTEEV